MKIIKGVGYMVIKNLEERLKSYNLFGNDWEIDYDDIMIGGQANVYPLRKKIGDKQIKDAIKVISIPREDEVYGLKNYTPNQIHNNITEIKEAVKKEYDTMLELRENGHVVPIKDVLTRRFDLLENGDELGCDIIIRMDYFSSLDNYMFDNEIEHFTKEEIIDCGIQICAALEDMHEKNKVHRDIKPQNIFVNKKSDGNLMFYLGDFGSIKESSMGLSRGRTLTMSGTELYLAPFWQDTRYRPQVDLYALGLTLFWMATGGRLPYERKHCKEILDREREDARKKRETTEEEFLTDDIDKDIANVIKKVCSITKTDEYYTKPKYLCNARNIKEIFEGLKTSKSLNYYDDKVGIAESEKVPEKIKVESESKSVERIYTKEDYKGEQILVIGDEYTGIADHALQGTPIVELTIGSSVKTFGQHIWTQCNSLRKIPVENYTIVYTGDFDGCTRLEEVIMPNCKIS